MIVAAAALMVQAISQPGSPQVEVVTAVTNVVIAGISATSNVEVDASGGVARPVISTSGGVTRVRDANQSARRIDGTYRITVPRSSRVTVRVRCVVVRDMPCPNAKVRIERVASVTYESFDGTGVISEVAGDVSAESLHGTVDIRNAGGRVNASSQTNAIRVNGAVGFSTIRSTTGMIFLESLLGGASVTNTTGEIRLAGRVEPSARYDMTTDIGHIRIGLADGTSARIEVNAPDNAVDVYTRDARISKVDSRRRTVMLGSGSAKITARTLNGAVDIGRRDRQ